MRSSRSAAAITASRSSIIRDGRSCQPGPKGAGAGVRAQLPVDVPLLRPARGLLAVNRTA
ncbi:MAG: hypothetical protein D6718_04140 [Acidobacteria bacterium]|nr:MAG: hypothetical protein D6718_04140 [Acidobacteriota bacterium]